MICVFVRELGEKVTITDIEKIGFKYSITTGLCYIVIKNNIDTPPRLRIYFFVAFCFVL